MGDRQLDQALLELTQGSARLEAIRAVLGAPEEQWPRLWAAADAVRRARFGREVVLRAIIEFSNYCCRNCYYCGLRQPNRTLLRYRMTFEEILATASEAVQAGFGTVILQSGEDPWYRREFLRDLIKEIKKLGPVAVTLSVGERGYDDLAVFREAGADRYLLKHETADEALYARLHPGHQLSERLRMYEYLRDLGYVIGGGFMLGLSRDSRAGSRAADLDLAARDTWLLCSLRPGMAGLGPFLPHPQTPMAGHLPGPGLLTLSVMAVMRLLLPDVRLPMTTALTTQYPELEFKALETGANVIMKKVEPEKYARLYEIYPKDFTREHSAAESQYALLAASLKDRGWMVR